MPWFRTRSAHSRYAFPPGLEHNLLWYAVRKFRPHDPIRLFQQLAARFGDIAHYKLGPEHILFLNHPDYIREVLVLQNANFVKERTVQRTKLLLGEGMITAEGNNHRRQRVAAQPAFHRQRIRDYAGIMVEEALMERESWRANTTIDVTAAINRIMELYHYLVLLPAIEVLVHFRAPKVGRFAEERGRLDVVVNRMIEEHRRTRTERRGRQDLLDMMIDSEEGSLDSDKRLRDQVITVFLAGYETVANALTWTWYLLSQNPDAEQRMQEELYEMLAHREANVDDVSRLRYTEMVVAESMRLFPPAWAMGRRAIHEFQLGPYRLPARTTLLMSQYV